MAIQIPASQMSGVQDWLMATKDKDIRFPSNGNLPTATSLVKLADDDKHRPARISPSSAKKALKP